VDQDSVERIRSATFNLARRGYDRREVDTFLQRLADWLEDGGEDQAHSELVQRELERIGQRTAGVLAAAGEAAAALRADAEAEAGEALDEARITANAARIEADRQAERVRGEADDYAQGERGKADAYAHEKRQAAEEEAERLTSEAKQEAARIVGEARRQRKELATVINDLKARRDGLVDELEELASSLAGAASRHRAADGEAAAAEDDTETVPIVGDETEKPAEAE
jgi:DivIVA domain-containing protein